MKSSVIRRGLATASLGASALFAPTAHADLALTADGTNLGFSLSTIVTGFPGFTILGSAINSAGNIMVTPVFSGQVRVYANVDNQAYGNTLFTGTIGNATAGMTAVAGVVYSGGGAMRKLNNDGTTAATYSNINLGAGMWTNPVSGKILAIGSATGVGSGLLEIDVSGATPVVRLVTSSANADGITVSLDGQFVYTSGGQRIDIATGAVTNNVFSVSGADGMGIISSTNAALNGDIVVNTTDGRLVLVDGSAFTQTVIASGGGYGDFTGPDTTNGTLMFGSGSTFYRLGCGAGCGIGTTPPPPPGGDVPVPASLMLVGLGLFGLLRSRK